MKAYAAFEGGGAKGLAHIGALKAAEEIGIEWVGVAGTSAGALIAAMTAAGFKADDICLLKSNGTGQTVAEHVLETWCEKAPKDLFTPGSWAEFAAFHSGLQELGKCLSEERLGAFGWSALKLVWKHWRRMLATLSHRGWFDTAAMVADFDKILSSKVSKRGEWVTFSELPMDLRIVAADVQHARPLIFDRTHHADTPVALAVAASIAVPGLLRPVTIPMSGQRDATRTAALLDGGMASNLPAWLFEDDSALSEEEIPIIAFSLDKQPANIDRIDDFLAAVLRTAVFGSQEIPLRRLGHLFEIKLASARSVGMLNMAISRDAAGTIISLSRGESFDILQRIVKDLEAVITDTLNDLAKGLVSKLELDNSVSMTASLALLGGDKHLKVRFQSSPGEMVRPMVQLHIDKSIAGHAFLSRDVVVWGSSRGLRTIHGTDQQFAPRPRLPDNIKTLVSIPIFEDATALLLPVTDRSKLWPLGVVTYETTADAWEPLQQEALRSRLLKQSAVWSALLTGVRVWRPFNGRD